jgi:hypothetical protein
MIAMHVGDRLVLDVPSLPDASWRLRGGAPVLMPTAPRPGEPAFVLRAAQPGRAGVDLVASGPVAARPLRLIVSVSQ